VGPIPNLTIGTRSHDCGNLVMWLDYIIEFSSSPKTGHMTVGKSHMIWLHNHFSDHQKRSHDRGKKVTWPDHVTCLHNHFSGHQNRSHDRGNLVMWPDYISPPHHPYPRSLPNQAILGWPPSPNNHDVNLLREPPNNPRGASHEFDVKNLPTVFMSTFVLLPMDLTLKIGHYYWPCRREPRPWGPFVRSLR